MIRVAVIGSGASALSVIHAALDTNLKIQVDLFDPWIELPKSNENQSKLEPKQIAKKGKFGSLAMYDYPSGSVTFDPTLHIPLSGTVGGLTSVWGANSLVPDSISLVKLTEGRTQESIDWVTRIAKITDLENVADNDDFYVSRRFRNLLEKFKIRDGVTLKASTLSMDTKSCIKLGGCLSGCEEGAIFSAEHGIYQLVSEGSVKLNKAFVQKIIVEDESNLTLEGDTEQNEGILYKGYDKVFVACGAIASCALLQRSELAPQTITLRDTQVFYSAYYLFENREENSSSLELAQLFLRKNRILHISLYEFSPQFLDRARIIVGPLVALIPKRFWRHIVAGIGFIDSSHSGKLILEYRDSRTYVRQHFNKKSKRQIRNNLSMVRKVLRGIGLLYIPFLTQVPNVGASYHVGVASRQDGPLFNSRGKIESFPGLEVYVLDSSSLPELPVGPITTTVMAAAYGRTMLALGND
jgi:ferredoxin